LENEYVPFPTLVDNVFTADGTAEIRDLFGTDVFEFPKPSKLIRKLVEQLAANTDIVLDFFAGSAATAQAVLELNREDGGNRRFIMVQLPEPTGRKEYATIADIGKDRIRRVISKLKKDDVGRLPLAEPESESDAAGAALEPGPDGLPWPEDLGFKVFTLHQPNIQQWMPDGNRDPDTYREKLSLFNDPLVAGWTPENVLWEVALREGFSLNTNFKKKELGNGNIIYEVTDADKEPPQTFTACLDDEIRPDFSKHYELSTDHLFVCRDKALDDTAAANLALQCRLKTI
jgi:adenine-specific DNA-methyltransferase